MGNILLPKTEDQIWPTGHSWPIPDLEPHIQLEDPGGRTRIKFDSSRTPLSQAASWRCADLDSTECVAVWK